MKTYEFTFSEDGDAIHLLAIDLVLGFLRYLSMEQCDISLGPHYLLDETEKLLRRFPKGTES